MSFDTANYLFLLGSLHKAIKGENMYIYLKQNVLDEYYKNYVADKKSKFENLFSKIEKAK